MVVTNTTKLDSEESINILTRTYKSQIARKYIYAIIVLICGIAILVLGLIQKDSMTITFGSLFSAFTIVYFIWIFVKIKKARNEIITKNQEVFENGITYNYTFKERSIEIHMIEGTKSTKVKYEYKDLNKVIEFKDYYELKVNKTLFIYVDKTGFKTSEMEQFFRRNLEKNKKNILNRIN